MSPLEEETAEPQTDCLSSLPSEAIYAAIAAFIYEESQQPVAEAAPARPSPMNPWKLLARRESVS